jgi:hypothetical protein
MIAEIDNEYIALARAVIIQAARDAAGGDRGAADWLASEEVADSWFIVAGVRRDAVLRWLAKGSRIKSRTKKPTISKAPANKKEIATIPAMG